MKKLIIFDLDGTILDTVEDIRFCLNSALKKFDLKQLNREQAMKNMGFGAKKLVQLSVGDVSESLAQEVYDYYLELSANSDNSKTTIYEGLDEVLINLKKDGYNLAVVSNKPDNLVISVCEQKLSKYGFSFVMGNKPGEFKPKPDKSCVEYCLNKLNTKKDEAIYVGDSEVDVQTYLASNVDGIGVLWGFRSKEILEDAGCTRLAKTPKELYNIIKSL